MGTNPLTMFWAGAKILGSHLTPIGATRCRLQAGPIDAKQRRGASWWVERPTPRDPRAWIRAAPRTLGASSDVHAWSGAC